MRSGLRRIFSLLSHWKITGTKEVVQVSEEQPVAKKEEPVNNGWLRIDRNAIFEEPNLAKWYGEIEAAYLTWAKSVDSEWLKWFRWYTPDELMIRLLDRRDKEVTEEMKRIDRLITAAAIYYGFLIPRPLCEYDMDTVEEYMKYHIVTAVKVWDFDTIDLKKYDREIEITNLADKVKQLSLNHTFRSHMVRLGKKGYFGLPNIYVLYVDVHDNAPHGGVIKALSFMQFKKVVTCYFMSCKVAIPKNYVQLDLDGIHWITKTGKYAPLIKEGNVVYLPKKESKWNNGNTK